MSTAWTLRARTEQALLLYASMPPKGLQPDQVERILAHGGLLIDLRPVDDYLAAHLPKSISILFELGPGLGTRARDLLPLDARLILIEDSVSSLEDATASFRGKGFDVAGFLAIDAGAGPGATVKTRTLPVAEARDLQLIDVADPGTELPANFPRPIFIPAESLWARRSEIPKGALGVLAGWGVRAATAVGIIEKLGFGEVALVRTKLPGATPPTADPQVFRVGGPP